MRIYETSFDYVRSCPHCYRMVLFNSESINGHIECPSCRELLYVYEECFLDENNVEYSTITLCNPADTLNSTTRRVDGCTLAKQAKEDAMLDDMSDLKDLEEER